MLTDAGEANILYCDNCEFCVNVDDIQKYHEGDQCPKCGEATLKPAIASEVGNVFDLGQKYSKAFDLGVTTKEGKKIYPIMGCYGIGISRTMGVIVEKFHDDKGIVWPHNIAPFLLSLISFEDTRTEADKFYSKARELGVEVLWDDRDVSAGVKFGDADLIGNPYRIVISKRSLEQGGVEVKRRDEKEGKIVAIEKVFEILNV